MRVSESNICLFHLHRISGQCFGSFINCYEGIIKHCSIWDIIEFGWSQSSFEDKVPGFEWNLKLIISIISRYLGISQI